MGLLRRIARVLAAALAAGAAAGLGVWLLGAGISDRWYPAQFVFWVPAIIALGAGFVALLVSVLLAAIGRDRARPHGRGSSGRRARSVLVMLLSIVLGLLLIRDWGVQRAIARERPAPDSPGTLRIVAWNPSLWNQKLPPGPLRSDRDVAILSNASGRTEWDQYFQAMVGPAGDRRWVRFVQLGVFTVLSEFDVLEFGSLAYDPGPAPLPLRWPSPQKVRLAYVVLGTADLIGRDVCIWLIDLPSSPAHDRAALVEELRARAAAWTGTAFRRTGDGLDEPLPQRGPGMPPPDLIVGDFNIPRGSASLRRLAPDLVNAFDLAGGTLSPLYAGSFPRAFPLWHLSQTLVGPNLIPTRYDLVDSGEGRHRMQLIDLRGR